MLSPDAEDVLESFDSNKVRTLRSVHTLYVLSINIIC